MGRRGVLALAARQSAPTVARSLACDRDRGLGCTTIRTSCPSAVSSRHSRSIEKPLSLPRYRFDRSACATPRRRAATRGDKGLCLDELLDRVR